MKYPRSSSTHPVHCIHVPFICALPVATYCNDQLWPDFRVSMMHAPLMSYDMHWHMYKKFSMTLYSIAYRA